MPDETLRRRTERIDEKIFHDRTAYLEAIWAGHETEAETYEYEVDRLLDFRTLLQRGLLTAVQIAEVDAL